MAEAGPRVPFVEYKDDKKDPQNSVTVFVEIKGIKKKVFGDEAANAKVTFSKEKRSFCLHVILDNGGKKDPDEIEYKVKKLPEPIDPERTKYKVKANEIVLYLRKMTPGSWSHHLASFGLEMEPD